MKFDDWLAVLSVLGAGVTVLAAWVGAYTAALAIGATSVTVAAWLAGRNW